MSFVDAYCVFYQTFCTIVRVASQKTVKTAKMTIGVYQSSHVYTESAE